MAGEEFRHVGSRAGQPGKAVHSRARQNEPQQALMLVNSLGLEALLASRADNDRCHLSAAMIQVGLVSLVKCDDEQSAALKCGVCNQGRNIGLQPRIRLA